MTEFLAGTVNVWISFAVWLVASVLCWAGASSGLSRHLVPRVVLAIGCTGLTVSFVVDLFGANQTAANMRRGWGWIVAVGVAWAAWSGIQARRDMERDTRQAAEELYLQIERSRRDIGGT